MLIYATLYYLTYHEHTFHKL